MHKHLILPTLVVALLGCNREPSPVPAASSPPPARTDVRSVEPSKELAPLVARLRYEADHRPSSAVTAERVLDALEHAQLPVSSRRQYLGGTLRASYCAGGVTRDGLAIAVCEYPDATTATAGKQLMDSRFAAMKQVALRKAHRNTVLTIAGNTNPSNSALVERAFEVFATL